MIHDAVVIGAGQAGLAVSRTLQRAGIGHVVLEGGTQPAGSWPHYYGSLRLFSPRRYSSLPDMDFPGDPDGYPGRDEVVAYLDAYARHFMLPVRCGARVERVRRDGDGFRLEMGQGWSLSARSVISATGAFSRPHMPALEGMDRFGGRLIHSGSYRTPHAFTGQRVVVVGAGNSAVQIAVELSTVARVSLATREPVKFLPQRILGRDLHFWFHWLGVDRSAKVSDQATPVIDAGRYARAMRDGRPDRRPMFSRFTPTGVVWHDGREETVDSVILATGFRPEVAHLEDMGALGRDGLPLHLDGVSTTVPGLFYMGLSRQRNLASATLRGVGPDAAVVVDAVVRHLAGRDERSGRDACCAAA